MLDQRNEGFRRKNLKEVERSFKRTVFALCALGTTALAVIASSPFRPLEDMFFMAALLGCSHFLNRRLNWRLIKSISQLPKDQQRDFPAQKEEKLTRIAQDFAAKLDLRDKERYCVKITPAINDLTDGMINGTSITISEECYRTKPHSFLTAIIAHEMGHADQWEHSASSLGKKMAIEKLKTGAIFLSYAGIVLTSHFLFLGLLAGTLLASEHHHRAKEYSADAYPFLLSGTTQGITSFFQNRCNPRTYTGFGRTWRDFKEYPLRFLGLYTHPTCRQRLKRIAQYEKRLSAG